LSGDGHPLDRAALRARTLDLGTPDQFCPGVAARYAVRVDNYQFVASLVSSLAWPVAVVIVIVVFRGPIGT